MKLRATLAFAVILLICLAFMWRRDNPEKNGTAATDAQRREAVLARGAAVYARHCAACHGTKGLGDGPVAQLLTPRPRDFSRATFRIISTDNGVPTSDDLFATITRGIPGSAMPTWAHLSEEDRRAVVCYIQRLTREGKVYRLLQLDDPPSREEAEQIADAAITPGQPLAIPPEQPVTAEALARGKALYMQSCVACHDADGRARQDHGFKSDDGFPIFARDFTSGIFKCGTSGADIARRIFTGMPGSPMPSFTNNFRDARDLWAVVHYVRTFIPDGAKTDTPYEHMTRVERGRWLFNNNGCLTCHGVGGTGGVPNWNYAKDTVPALNVLAERMKLDEKEDADRIVDLLERGVPLDSLKDSPPVPRYNVVLAQFGAIRELIRNGSTAAKKDVNGPDPPLDMPAWDRRLSMEDIDSIISYLLTQEPWDEQDK